MRLWVELDYGPETLRAHLEQVEQSGVVDPRLLAWRGFPEECLYVWEMFIQISVGRGSTAFGPAPLSFQVMESWGRLMGGMELTPWEIELLLAMDVEYLKSIQEKLGKNG